MTSWSPVRRSSAADRRERASSSASLSRFAMSTTRPLKAGSPDGSEGGATAPARLSAAAAEGAAPPQAASASAAAAAASAFTPLSRALLAVAEAHPGRVLGAFLGLVRLHRLAAVDDPGADHGGEGPDRRIIGLDRLVIVAPGDRDPVFRPFELGLERHEILVGA